MATSRNKQVLAGKLGRFVQEYARKAPKGREPNDRHYDRKIEQQMKQMSPESLSALLSEESESISEAVVDCGTVFTEGAFWNAYIDAVKPHGAAMFGRNLDALWDALEGDGPGSPTQSRVVFANTVTLASLRDGEFLSALKEIARDCTRMEVVVS